jgi:uncharacterized phage protein gp47/JayE
MIDFSGKTKAAILAEMLAEIPDTYDKRDTSPIQTALGPAAYQFEGIYLALGQMQLQAFIGTAVGEDLDSLATMSGLTRLGATPAVRLGVFNTPVSIGARFSTVNGSESINFVVTAATSNPLEWWLTAETPGSIGNAYAGPILPITTIPGLTSAELTTIIVDGSDAETDAELRARMVTALTDRPFAGNIASYRKMLLEMTEATGPDGTTVAVKLGAVQVYPIWDGPGTVKCSILGSDYLPVSNELLAVIQNTVDPTLTAGQGIGLAPIGAEVTIGTGTSVAINVSATVAHVTGTTMESIQGQVEAALRSYLAEVRSEWGLPDSTDMTLYRTAVYVARVTAAILGVQGVTNVTSVRLNGSASDLNLTETSALQQVPILGTVTLTEG